MRNQGVRIVRVKEKPSEGIAKWKSEWKSEARLEWEEDWCGRGKRTNTRRAQKRTRKRRESSCERNEVFPALVCGALVGAQGEQEDSQDIEGSVHMNLGPEEGEERGKGSSTVGCTGKVHRGRSGGSKGARKVRKTYRS